MTSASHELNTIDRAHTVQAGLPSTLSTRRALLGVAAAVCAACLVATGPADRAEARQPFNADQGKGSRKTKADEIPKGPLTIIISINKQKISLYAGKTLVTHSSVSTGMRGHPTPLGVFTVIQKQKWHRSNLYSAAPMPYMQRITWSGVALHAGVLPGYPASHGCIRLSYEFATRLWHLTKTGVRVIIAHDDLAPADIVSPRLFVPTAKIDATKAAVADPLNPVQAVKTATAAPTDLKASSLAVSDKPPAPQNAPAVSAPRRTAPISVLISRKLGKLFVRQATVALFDTPVIIRDPQQPLGTHVFTAVESSTTAAMVDWTVVSIAEAVERRAEPGRRDGRTRGDRTEGTPTQAPPGAEAALDRIDIPEQTLARISELLVPGSSLIISDHGISEETDSDTDFIVLTR